MSKKMVPSISSAAAANQLDAFLVALKQRRQQICDKGLRKHLGERHLSQQRNQPRNKFGILRGLDDQCQLHRRCGHLDGRFGALVQCTVHDVGPVNQVGDRCGIESETCRADVRQKAGARGVVRIEELARSADRVLLAGKKMLVILRGEKGREMVVEPPGNARRGRVLEVDNRVFIARKLTLVEECTGAMDEAVIVIPCVAVDALAMKARKEGRGAGSVEALVVIEDVNLQPVTPCDRIR